MAGVINKLMDRNVLTADGEAWLEAALDPMHDEQLRTRGLPDQDVARVLVETFQETQTVSAPAGTTGNWDAHVYTLPIGTVITPTCGVDYAADKYNFVSTGYNGSVSQAALAQDTLTELFMGNVTTTRTLGLCNIDTFTSSGFPLAPTTAGGYAPPAQFFTMGKPAISSGKRRLIAVGLQIQDVTAPNFKQGTMTVSRIPQAWTKEEAHGDSSTIYTSGASPYGPYGVKQEPGTTPLVVYGKATPRDYWVADLPPATTAEAMTYPGSRQWKMEDGLYSVVPQDVLANRLQFNEAQFAAFTDGDYQPPNPQILGIPTPTADYSLWFNSSARTKVVNLVGGSTASVWEDEPPSPLLRVPFHTISAMLTGLNVNSSFTVTLKTIWEVAPDFGDTNGPVLVPLTHPSPAYDPVALELYQRAVCTLPVGVPVGMNPTGDWWDWVLRAMGAAAGPVAGLLLGPGTGAAVGAAAAAGIEGLRSKRNARDKVADAAMANLAKMDISNFKARAQPAPPKPVRVARTPQEQEEFRALEHKRATGKITPGQQARLSQLVVKTAAR